MSPTMQRSLKQLNYLVPELEYYISEHDSTKSNERPDRNKYLRIIVARFRIIIDWIFRRTSCSFLATTIGRRVQLVSCWTNLSSCFCFVFLAAASKRVAIVADFARRLSFSLRDIFTATSKHIQILPLGASFNRRID